MPEHIVTDSNGRKYITNEPLLHARTYTQDELDAAVVVEREQWEYLVRQVLEVMENHRSEHAQSRITGLVYGLRQRLPEYGLNARTNRPL